MAEEYKLRADLAAIVSNAGSVAHWNTAEDRLVNAARADLARAAEADALAAGVKAGLLAAAEAYATHRIIGLAQYAPKGWRHTVYNDLRTIAADAAKVAAIAASTKGGRDD